MDHQAKVRTVRIVVIAGGWLLFTTLTGRTLCGTRRPTEEEMQQRRAVVEQMRERSRVAPGIVPDHEVTLACKGAVKTILAAPDEADIDSPSLPDRELATDGTIYWRGSVKGKNLYGVKLSKRFVCSYDPQGKRARAFLQ